MADETETLEEFNTRTAKVLGCAEAMSEAQQSGADAEDISVAMDALQTKGWDECVKFLSEQTGGKYPPRSGLLRRELPEEYRPSSFGKVEGWRMRRHCWWDSLRLEAGGVVTGYRRLFGNANIGSTAQCSLLAGSLGDDAFISGWSVIHNGEDFFMEHLLREAVFTLTIGDMPQATRLGFQLLEEAQPIDVFIPRRRNFDVEVQFSPNHPENIPALSNTFWVILEGWEIR